MHRILVLGGYGFFGSRICAALAEDTAITLIIAGRDKDKALALAGQLKLKPEQVAMIDAQANDLATQLQALQVNTVIHTAGPFQGQGYDVARACIAAGAHYIDLADGRDFVSGIHALDEVARERGVLVTSGASSLPSLSSAVVDRYKAQFSQLTAIRHGIGSGARAPGLATMRGVFGYCGKPFTRLERGTWRTVFGWLNLSLHRFPAPVGYRLLGNCDVPDLVLFPTRYPGVKTVTFQAGFASNLGHLFVWSAAWLVRAGLLRSMVDLVIPLNRISRHMERFVSDKGGMYVTLDGLNMNGKALQLTWNLVASDNHGPQIPCGASIALARKLAAGHSLPRGAMPCMGLLTVDEYLAALSGFNIQEIPT